MQAPAVGADSLGTRQQRLEPVVDTQHEAVGREYGDTDRISLQHVERALFALLRGEELAAHARGALEVSHHLLDEVSFGFSLRPFARARNAEHAKTIRAALEEPGGAPEQVVIRLP